MNFDEGTEGGGEMSERSTAYKQALEEIREVYTGSDGFIPETAPEAYQQRLLKQMYDIAVKAIAR